VVHGSKISEAPAVVNAPSVRVAGVSFPTGIRRVTTEAMLALASVWIAAVTLVLAAAMAVYRPSMTNITVTAVLSLGCPGALCLAGLTLWAHRKADAPDLGIAARRIQAKVAIGMALAAAAIVYLLIIFSQKLMPIE